MKYERQEYIIEKKREKLKKSKIYGHSYMVGTCLACVRS